MIQLSINPYDPPQTIELANDLISQARRRLSRPATALIIMASIHSVFVSMQLFPMLASHNPFRSEAVHAIPILILSIQFTCLILIAIGAAKMGFLESLTLARLAATLACIPIVTPFVLLGLPFGFWSHQLLRDPEILRAFKAARAEKLHL